ncbi:hypothetical protein D3C71_1923030 [compost metagenome]
MFARDGRYLLDRMRECNPALGCAPFLCERSAKRLCCLLLQIAQPQQSPVVDPAPHVAIGGFIHPQDARLLSIARLLPIHQVVDQKNAERRKSLLK